ncbi:uncharacterized protein LTR77_009068 [Saxophila tyrrhenica]|uniref:Uncharacterized protein n=1 Tax=Saxophila tyrrhenica TaxID=1690608 RepID=A0AAV9P383_9PEZI|nr:hypothetical protein LTR77_009068 [Saxophila tyrrhenica]
MALITGVSSFDVFAAGHLRIAEGLFATCRFFAFAPIVVMLWVMVSPTKSTNEVFGKFRDYTGTWSSVGVSVLAGQVTGIFACARSDALAHLSEEVEDAAVVVPRSMVWTYALSFPFTLIVLLTYCFNIGSVEEALQSTHPLVYVLCNALSAAGPTTGFAMIILILLAMITISALASASRQIFAFAYVFPTPNKTSPHFTDAMVAATTAFPSPLGSAGSTLATASPPTLSSR